jgi:hypothetical protein
MRLLVEEFCEAENHHVRQGDDKMKIEFKTKREARPWIVEKRVVNLFVQKSDYSTAQFANGEQIDAEQIRFMAIDRQQDHWWVEIGAFASATGPVYRQLYFGRIETRDQLRQLQQRYKVPGPVRRAGSRLPTGGR